MKSQKIQTLGILLLLILLCATNTQAQEYPIGSNLEIQYRGEPSLTARNLTITSSYSGNASYISGVGNKTDCNGNVINTTAMMQLAANPTATAGTTVNGSVTITFSEPVDAVVIAASSLSWANSSSVPDSFTATVNQGTLSMKYEQLTCNVVRNNNTFKQNTQGSMKGGVTRLVLKSTEPYTSITISANSTPENGGMEFSLSNISYCRVSESEGFPVFSQTSFTLSCGEELDLKKYLVNEIPAGTVLGLIPKVIAYSSDSPLEELPEYLINHKHMAIGAPDIVFLPSEISNSDQYFPVFYDPEHQCVGAIEQPPLIITVVNPEPPILNSLTATNTCPATTIDLNSVVVSVKDNLKWYNATDDTEVPNPSAAVAGTYYAMYVYSGSCDSKKTAVVTATVEACCPAGNTAPPIVPIVNP